MPPAAVQARLREGFAARGLPLRLRVDNGGPWGSWNDLPPDLALWLLGLGVDVLWNPPRRPQDNGVVERSQGTAKRWAEPWACDSPEELQRRLQEMDDIQRGEYPSVGGRSRLEAYPGLAHSGRPYSPEWEARHWDLGRALAFLSGVVVRRRVDSSGKASLCGRHHYVGALHKGKEVHVQFDPQLREWVFADDNGAQLRRHPAPYLNRESIMTLTVTHRG